MRGSSQAKHDLFRRWYCDSTSRYAHWKLKCLLRTYKIVSVATKLQPYFQRPNQITSSCKNIAWAKNKVKVRTTTRIVGMAIIATVALLAIGSTSTMAMAHSSHHSDGGCSDSGSSDSQANCGFAQTIGSDGLCHYGVRGALNECANHLSECITLGKLVLGSL